jgi:hypothetical protein
MRTPRAGSACGVGQHVPRNPQTALAVLARIERSAPIDHDSMERKSSEEPSTSATIATTASAMSEARQPPRALAHEPPAIKAVGQKDEDDDETDARQSEHSRIGMSGPDGPRERHHEQGGQRYGGDVDADQSEHGEEAAEVVAVQRGRR